MERERRAAEARNAGAAVADPASGLGIAKKLFPFVLERIIRTADRLAEYHFRCVQRWRMLQLSTPELNCMLAYDVILSILSVRICVSLVPHTHVLKMANRQLGR